MGLIRQKSIHYSVVHFTGVLIGTLSTILVYPLDRESYGLARLLIDFSIFLYPFALLGFESVAIKYFPLFRDSQEAKARFLGMLLKIVLLACISVICIGWLWGWEILEWLELRAGMHFSKDPLIKRYIWLSLPIIFFMSIGWLFNQYLSNFHRILFPAIFQNLIKISLPVLVLLIHYKIVGVDILAYGITANFLLVAVLYIVYSYAIGELRVSWRGSRQDGEKWFTMLPFAMFSLFGSLGTLIAFRIDSIMVSTMIGLEHNGDFGIASTIAQTIAIPMNAIIAIGAPVLATAWASTDMSKIKEVYQKSSINLLIPGLWIYAGMWACLDPLLALLPSDMDLSGMKAVILLLGAARIFDMATGINNEIIAYSKHFRFNFATVLLLAVSNIVLNLYFIPRHGILGAAMATSISLMVYNMAKFVFIWIRMDMQPFTTNTLKAIGIALLAYGSVAWWPLIFNPLYELVLKSAVLSGVFLFFAWRLSLSEDLINLIHKTGNFFTSKK
jgi:O-antigen/teichoic acid export membrane protein